ncbi:MAG: NlpC/P60 family protein [Armatimonadetes bacterium]|nr:NlpC/P60 family protein [Armatimonadota bacterium]
MIRTANNPDSHARRATPGAGRFRAPALVAAALLAFCLTPVHAAAQAGAPDSSQQADPDQPAEAAKTLAAQGVEFSYEIYQVCSGDTVENIAARFGIPAARIRQFNDLGSTPLSSGQSIAVPLTAKPAPRRAPRDDRPALNLLEPCYALVISPCTITSAPGESGEDAALYEPQVGSQLIVNAERGGYWSVVMIDGSAGWVPKSALEMTDRTIPPDQLESMLSGGRPDLVQEALRYLGTPYRYGGRLPYDVDCSLLVQAAYAAKGIRLPRTAAQQFEVGRSVSYNELLPGDRLYFVSKSGRINHPGIYIGNGRFVHASSRRHCVGIDALYDRIYWTRFLGARRS